MTIINRTDSINVPSIATGTTALASNPARVGWSIQNVGTNALFVNLGGTASSTVFHAVLKGGTADSDGLGSTISQLSGTVFTGTITVAGTTPKYVVTELGN